MPHSKNAPLRARTKIVATVGPACRQPAQLSQLVAAGVDVFRVNMAHGNRAEHEAVVSAIRQASHTHDRPIAILVDLAGPKIRLGELYEDPTRCAEGAEFHLVRGETAHSAHELPSNYPPLLDHVSVGDVVMLADGTVSMRVEQNRGETVRCRVVAPGMIRSRQGINLPGVKLTMPSMTNHDRDCAVWAATRDIDLVGLSFVRGPEDVEQLKELLRSHGSGALVIAKIEKQEALDNLDRIVAATDGVMVARGDLGVETDVAQMPVAQKRIIATCNRFGRPVIVATQMLDSMHRSSRPTRAEVTDVANAVLDGADACMLSGETAIGAYPREAVKMMNRILLSTETVLRDLPPKPPAPPPTLGVDPVTSAAVYGAGQIARQLCAKLVVVATRSGATALAKSAQRDFIPTIAVSDSMATLRQIALFWGITPVACAPSLDRSELYTFIDQWGQADGSLVPGDHVVLVTGSGPGAHNQIVVHEVEPG